VTKCEDLIHEKYEEFSRCLVGRGEYLSGIYLSDLMPFVLGHLCRSTQTAAAFGEVLARSLKRLRAAVGTWHMEPGGRWTAYLLALSDLYLLSFCPGANGYEVSRAGLSELLGELNDKRFWLWFFDRREGPLSMPDPHCRIMENLLPGTIEA
jgi:hypothetical protein